MTHQPIALHNIPIGHLQDRVDMLEAELRVTVDFPPELPFTRTESEILSALLRRQTVTHEQLLAFIWQGNPTNRGTQVTKSLILVHVCKLHRKLRPLGIEISSDYANGYFLSWEAKRTLIELVAATRANAEGRVS